MLLSTAVFLIGLALVSGFIIGGVYTVFVIDSDQTKQLKFENDVREIVRGEIKRTRGKQNDKG